VCTNWKRWASTKVSSFTVNSGSPSSARLRAVPELFVPGPPLRHRLVTLTLVDDMQQVHVGEPDHPHLGYHDHRDSPVLGVHDSRLLADSGHWVVAVLVCEHEAGGRGLRTGQSRGHQPVPQWARKRELRQGKIIEAHAGQGTGTRHGAHGAA
jgi:hypothetical protein